MHLFKITGLHDHVLPDTCFRLVVETEQKGDGIFQLVFLDQFFRGLQKEGLSVLHEYKGE
jgi:hypothetical protein